MIVTAPVALLSEVTLGKMVQPRQKNEFEQLRPYMRAAHVQPNGFLDLDVEPHEMWFSPGELQSLDLRRGDVVVVEGGVGGYGRAAYLSRDIETWGFQNSIVRLRPRPGIDGRFIAYSLVSARSQGEIAAECLAAGMPHFTAEKVSRFRIPYHETPEQRRIADYLDRETAEIDAMDAELDRLIETLRERDLRLNQAPIDMSGYPEVGLGHLASVTLGKMLDQDKNVGDPTPYVRAANITTAGSVSLDDIKEMRMTDAERARLDIRGGDTLMIEGGDAGRVAFVPTVMHGMSFQKTVLRIRPTHPDLDPRYLYLALRQAHRSGRIALDHSTSTIPHFTAEKAERLLVPVPSLIEQRRIVAEIDGQTVQVNEMVASAERLKALLAERRSTLITEVVTGVKEVPV